MTTVDQSLEFMEERSSQGDSLFKFDSQSDLSYHHDHSRSVDKSEESHVKETLSKHPFAETSELPKYFDELVYGLRSLKHSQMVNIYYSLRNQRTVKFFQDALPLLKTDAGVTLMKDIINSGELKNDIVDKWFSSLSFYKNPTRGMLSVLSSFINEKSRSSALLGVSGLASTFCSNNPNCLEIAELKQMVDNFEKLLGNSCESQTSEEELHTVLVLKSLRNIGHIQNSKPTLLRCLKNKNNSLLTRVSVLETIRKSNAF